MYATHSFTELRKILLAVTIVTVALLATLSARAADLTDHARSLEAIPGDASCYVAWLRNREQIELLTASRAWQKLKTIPALQLGIMQLQTYWQYPPDPRLADAKDWLEGEVGQQLAELLADMGSDEIFVYANADLTHLLKFGLAVNSEISRLRFRQAMDDQEDVRLEDLIAEKAQAMLEQHGDKLSVPGVVLGFRIQEQDRATELLDVLTVHVESWAEQCPLPIQDKLERTTTSERDLLTLTLTSDMLPWAEMEQEFEEMPELYATVRDLLQDKKVVIAVGVVDEFVVLSVGESTAQFENLGEGPLLAQQPAIQRLATHADEDLTSLAYVSELFLQTLGSPDRSIEEMLAMGQGLLQLADLDEDQRADANRDMEELAEAIMEFLPEPGQIAAAEFLTDRGYETYVYNWAEQPSNLDGTQPLDLLRQIGGSTLGFYVSRTNNSVEIYDLVSDWLRRIAGLVESIAETKADPDDWDRYSQVREEVVPLLQRLDRANRELMVPAFADGQRGIVLSKPLLSDTWCEFMSPADEQFPLPTLAFIDRVSDKDKLTRGAAEYFDVVQAALDVAHESDPDEIPPFKLPTPDVKSTSKGRIYSYPLPSAWGASERIAPNAALSDDTLVVSLLPEVSESMLSQASEQLSGPAAEFDRPLLKAAHFKCADLIRLMQAWMDYGIQLALEQRDGENAGAIAMIGIVKPQVDQVLDVLTVFRSYTSVTYREDDTWVTHAESHLQDLED